MRQYYASDKKKREEAKRRKKEEKRLKRLSTKAENQSTDTSVVKPQESEKDSNA